ncbi:hypothetical protein P2Q00_28585 [Streptomyces coacervatus]|uniref:hypothetical protein n=1 Tax=Streptomyces coacervatus TaxID=647381 RepID=UPI0023DAB497|nr:hypothetical protein [Streptomyces coacervatus]MDF2269369.1 hypothetical protein [Streptomyces coacervatus]
MINALGALSTGIGTLLTGTAAVLMARRGQNSTVPAATPSSPPGTSVDPAPAQQGEGYL